MKGIACRISTIFVSTSHFTGRPENIMSNSIAHRTFKELKINDFEVYLNFIGLNIFKRYLQLDPVLKFDSLLALV